nr:InlB B-repeat-containing protein [Lachnospiraceae bacterium]
MKTGNLTVKLMAVFLILVLALKVTPAQAETVAEDLQIEVNESDLEESLMAEGVSVREINDKDIVWGEEGVESWYKLVPTASSSSEISLADRIKVKGKVNLILSDGMTLLSKGGINVPMGSELIIHGGTEGTGLLHVKYDDYSFNAGIGGNHEEETGNITVNGGRILIDNGKSTGAGIGSGWYGVGGTITINGGEITVKAGSDYQGGAGIGGGLGGSSGNIIINGGRIETAGGKGGAGIGGGYGQSADSITINAGEIKATGGDRAAGIGGGLDGSVGRVIIKGDANVVASSNQDGVGIGRGGKAEASAELFDGVLEVGEGLVVYGGSGENPTEIIRRKDNDYSRHCYMTVKKGTIPPVKVDIKGGNNSTQSGSLNQTGLTAEMETVTFTADNGYSFASFEDIVVNEVKVTRVDYKTVTVSGTPLADTLITVPDAIESKEITVNVTFKVIDGSWDDGTKNDKTIAVKGIEGEIRLSSDQIPAVGTKADDGYDKGYWDLEPDKELLWEDKTFSYYYTRKDGNKKYNPAYRFNSFSELIDSDATIQIAGVRTMNQVANWYVIDYDEKEKTLTLLARESFGYSKEYEEYANSDLRKTVEGLTDKGQALYSIRKQLANVSLKEEGIEGSIPYVLDYSAASKLSEEKLTGYGTRWWLRSNTTPLKDVVEMKNGKGQLVTEMMVLSEQRGYYDAPKDKACVSLHCSIRPAIKLKLDSLAYDDEKKLLYTDIESIAFKRSEMWLGKLGVMPLSIVSKDDSGSTYSNIIWSSSDRNIVKLYKDEDCTEEIGSEPVDSGLIYAKGIELGEAVVTAANALDPSMSSSCKVEVLKYVYDYYLNEKSITCKNDQVYHLYTVIDYNMALSHTLDPTRTRWEISGAAKDLITLYEDEACTRKIETTSINTESMNKLKTGWVNSRSVYVKVKAQESAFTNAADVLKANITAISKVDPSYNATCVVNIPCDSLQTQFKLLKKSNQTVTLEGLKNPVKTSLGLISQWKVVDVNTKDNYVTIASINDYMKAPYWGGISPDFNFDWIGPNDFRYSVMSREFEKLTKDCFGYTRDAVFEMSDKSAAYFDIVIKGFYSLSSSEVEAAGLDYIKGDRGDWWLRDGYDKADDQSNYVLHPLVFGNPSISHANVRETKGLRPAINLKLDYLDYDPSKNTIIVHYDSGIYLDQKNISLVQGNVTKITASPKIYDEDTKIIWSCKNENVFLYEDEDCTQVIDAEATNVKTVYVKGMRSGTSSVKAASSAHPGVYSECSVNIRKAPGGYTGFDALNSKDQTVRIEGVKYNDKDVEWYVIGSDSTNDTITLFSRDCLGESVFSGPDYQGSELRKYVENLTEKGKPLFPVRGILAQVDARDPSVGGKVPYLPSDDEIGSFSKTKKSGDGKKYWSRSHVKASVTKVYTYQGGVGGDWHEPKGGEKNGVRPIIKLSLKSLLFDPKTNTFKFEKGVSLDKSREEVKGGNVVVITALTDEEKLHWESSSDDLEIYACEDLSLDISPGVTTVKKVYAVPYTGGSFTVTATGKESEKVASCEIVSIMEKSDYSGQKTESIKVESKKEAKGLKYELPDLPKGAAYGESGLVGGTTPGLINGTPTIKGSILTINTTSQDEGVTATITIPVTGAENYKDYEVVVTVTTAKKEDAGVSIDEKEKIYKAYGADAFTPKVSVKNPGSGTVNESWILEDEKVAKLSEDGKITVTGVGETKITYRYESDETAGEASVVLKVVKTALAVQANDNDIVYGDEPQGAGVTYTGFVNNENKEVLSGSLDYDYSYSRYQNVGEDYTITPKGLTADNYQIVYLPGKLRVFQKSVGIQWGTCEFAYDGTVKCPEASAVGLLNKDECTFTVTGGEKEAGSYSAKVTGLSNANYKLPSDNTKSFTIRKAANEFTAPKAKSDLFYTGLPVELLDKGSTKYGFMVYALGSDDKNPPEEKYFTGDIPTAINAGTYNIWYRVYGDKNHEDLAPQCIKAEIMKKGSYKVEISLKVANGTGVETSVDLKQYLKGYLGNEFTVNNIVTVDDDPSSFSFEKGEKAASVDSEGILKFVTNSEKGGKGRLDLTAANASSSCEMKINVEASSKITRIHFYETKDDTPAMGVEAEDLKEYIEKQEGSSLLVEMDFESEKEPSDSEVKTRMEKALKETYGAEEYNLGDVGATYFDINVTKKVDDKAEEKVKDLSDVIAIGVKYDLTNKYFPLVFRDLDKKSEMLTMLGTKPASKAEYKDGSFYIDYESSTVFIYTRYPSVCTLAYRMINSYPLIYDMCGKDAENVPEDLWLRMGERPQRPSSDPKAKGFIFTDWYADEACENLFDFTIPLKDETTVYAGWREKKKLTVSFDPNGVECTYFPKDKELGEGESLEAPGDPQAEGYEFKGWYKESACETLYDFKTVLTEDIRLYAAWESVEPESSEEEAVWNLFEDPSDHEYSVQGISTETELLNSNPKSKKYFDARMSGSVITVKVTGDRKKAAKNPVLEFDLGSEGVIEYTLPLVYQKPAFKLSSASATIKQGTDSVLYTTLLVKNSRGIYEACDLTDLKLSGTGFGSVTPQEDGRIRIVSSQAGSGKIRISKDDWDQTGSIDLRYSVKASKKDLLSVD